MTERTHATMFTVTKYPHGTLSWADCASANASAAIPFYTELMGWTTQDLPMGDDQVYTMFKRDGHDVAGLSQLQPNQPPQSYWTTYITVDDVDSMPDKVRALGGIVLAGPFDVFQNGRMMLIQDPSGGTVALWQAISHVGAQLLNVPGAMTWNELNTRDVEKAKAFFGELLGWEFAPGYMPGYFFIHNPHNNGRINGGILEMSGEAWGEMPSHWMVYFSVADIDAALAKAAELGGTVATEIIEAAGTGRFAVITDPAGAHLTAIQLEKPMPWQEA